VARFFFAIGCHFPPTLLYRCTGFTRNACVMVEEIYRSH
jgi:hypothetical protein